jgi:hypothetical protein
MTKSIATHRATIVQTLGEQLRQLETTRFTGGGEIVTSGNAALDRLLPEAGFRRGSLVEWLSESAAGGAATLALCAAQAALAQGGALVIVDRQRRFYPPAAVRLGLPLEKLIVVRPADDAEHNWAIDQTLRSRGVAAVWGAVDRVDDHVFRRWQLAAESSGVLGFLIRGQRARSEPSWAELRLGVEPVRHTVEARGRRLCVELLRSRLGRSGAAIELELPGVTTWRSPHESHFEAHPLHLASPLALAKARRRTKRA